MTDNEIIIAVAKLDGLREAFPRDPALGKDRGGILLPYKYEQVGTQKKVMEYPDYLNSRDAIIPVIEKIEPKFDLPRFHLEISKQQDDVDENTLLSWNVQRLITATPRQLCIALLKATGNWRDE